MKTRTERSYQPTEFARRAGVTVRALHFYDRFEKARAAASPDLRD